MKRNPIKQGLRFYCGNENPRLGLGFQKAYSVVLKKLFCGAKIFLVRQPE